MVQVTKIKNGCNCYLVENEGEGILIDTGMTAGADRIIKACKGKSIKRIILTHGHVDHIQCAKRVAQELSAEITMHENDLELIQNNLLQPMYGRKFFGKVMAFFSRLSASAGGIDAFEADDVISGDRELTECGMNVKLIELPGHTRGSIGVRIDNHFFVGDALMNMTGPDISLLYENMDDLRASAARIAGAGDVIIHFGHGSEVRNRQWV